MMTLTESQAGPHPAAKRDPVLAMKRGFVGRCPNCGEGHIFREDGRLVASYTIHAMVRDFVQGPEAMGHDASTAM